MKAAIIGVVTAALLGLGGWYYVTQVHSNSIGKIVNNPRNYVGKDLTISGTVTDRFSLYVIKYFNLRDSTGDITVVTDRLLPPAGAKIRVKGQVKEAFSLGDQQLLVFQENTQ